MKKILFMAISLFAMLAVSCTNDEIEITKSHNVTLSINTKKMYDDFGITSTVTEEFLRNHSRCVGVISYIYDAKGSFVKKEESHLENLNSTTQTLGELVDGEYTIITIETLLNPDVNFESDVWSIDGFEELSTLKITQRLGDPDDNGNRWTKLAYEGNVIGVNIANITLTRSEIIEVNPAPIGSLVHFNSYNFEKSSYAGIGYTTQDILDYYSLDPSLSRDSRYHKNLTASTKTNVRIHLSSDADPDNYFSTYILEKDLEWAPFVQTSEQMQTGYVTVMKGLGSAEILDDGKTYQIGCYYGKDGNIYSYFGNETGLTNWKANLDRTVGPPVSSTIFETPYTNWSVGTVSAVKSYMSNFDLWQDIQYDDIYEAYSMTYFDDSFNMYDYVFTSSTRGLTDVYVWPDSKYTLAQIREEVVKQGYTYNSQNNNNYYYTSNSTYVTVYQSSTGTIFVNYYDPKAYGLSAPKKAISESYVNSKIQSKGIHTSRSLTPVKSSMRLSPFANKEIKKVMFK